MLYVIGKNREHAEICAKKYINDYDYTIIDGASVYNTERGLLLMCPGAHKAAHDIIREFGNNTCHIWLFDGDKYPLFVSPLFPALAREEILGEESGDTYDEIISGIDDSDFDSCSEEAEEEAEEEAASRIYPTEEEDKFDSDKNAEDDLLIGR
jgi:hypothetical protein